MPDKAMSVADISVFAVRTGYQPKRLHAHFFTFKNFSRLDIYVSMPTAVWRSWKILWQRTPLADAQVNMAVVLVPPARGSSALPVTASTSPPAQRSLWKICTPSIDLVLDKWEAQVKKFVSRNKEIHRRDATISMCIRLK